MYTLTLGLHWMCVHSGTAPLRVCSALRCPPTPAGCIQAAFQIATQLDSRTAGVMRLRDFAVITESSRTAASENL